MNTLKLKKNDLIYSAIIGEIVALIFLGISKNIDLAIPFSPWLLILILPLLSMLGLWLAGFLGRKIPVIFQIAKFLLVGTGNTLVDLGILNLLIWLFGISVGLWYSVFKAISFTGAVVHSYFWNKFWTFEKKETERKTMEFSKFYLITGIGFLINVGIASLVVNVWGAQFGLSDKIWANIGGITAALIVAAWNFSGYKFIVFKK